MHEREGLLIVERLRELVDAGTVDTVLVAMADMQGRPQGKLCSARVTSCSARTSARCGCCPWHEATAQVLADVEWVDGGPVPASPRQVLRRQLNRLAERDLQAFV